MLKHPASNIAAPGAIRAGRMVFINRLIRCVSVYEPRDWQITQLGPQNPPRT